MKTQIETAYAPKDDITFILEYTYHGGELVKMECVGWYAGEPDPAATEEFYGDLTAKY